MDILTNTTERVPFAETEVTPYLPGFAASLNGIEVHAHVDTGGTFLHMGVHRAKEFGISLTEAGKGKHGAREVDIFSGVAKSFDLGPVRMENVPVVALPSLKGPQDFIIFGTNLLQCFLPTIDYPNKILVLRPKALENQTSGDLQSYIADAVAVPFRLLGDHYMVAEGGIASQQNLAFFIDSGLVSLHEDESGTVRQAAFIAAKDDFVNWGVDLSNKLSSGGIQLSQDLSLGTLSQPNHIALAPDRRILSSVDDIEIHGLLSHAFLKEYAWTIDFDAGMFYFKR